MWLSFFPSVIKIHVIKEGSDLYRGTLSQDGNIHFDSLILSQRPTYSRNAGQFDCIFPTNPPFAPGPSDQLPNSNFLIIYHSGRVLVYNAGLLGKGDPRPHILAESPFRFRKSLNIFKGCS
jgi:hypothetical protein